MFSEKTVKKILGLTKKTLLLQEPDFFPSEREVDESIEVLYQLMMIPDDEIDFGNAYAEAFEEYYFEDSEMAAKLFSNEGLMKKILRIKDMSQWNAGPIVKPGQPPKTFWQLGDLIYYFRIKDRYSNAIKAQIRQANNGMFPLSQCDPNLFINEMNLCEHHCRAIKSRNISAHDMAEEPMELAKMRQSVLLVYLDMCARYKNEIKAKYAEIQVEKVFDQKHYLEKIIDAYKEREKKYLTVYWRNINGADVANKKKITTLVDTDTESKVIKLIGSAGVGKSESIKYAQYHQCKQCMQASGNKNVLPIRIELIDLNEKVTLNVAIARELNVMEENLENIFTTASVTLYLDGYNEILDTEVRVQASKDIDNLIKKYPKMKFVIADRSANTNPRCADKATCYQLEPLNENQIKEFFKKNTLRPGSEEPDSQILQDIMDNYQQKYKWLENSKTTPFMLLAVIEMLQMGAAFPGEPTGFLFKYLDSLLQREDVSKHDARIEVLKECLTDLVEEVLPDESATATIRRVRKSFMTSGAGDMDKAVGLVKLAMDMGILEAKEEAEEIGWAKPEYFGYFFCRFE